MKHKNLALLKRSKKLMKEIHKMTLVLSTMVSDSIARGYRNKHYNYEFIKYLVSNRDHDCHDIETLFEKGELTPENFYAALKNKMERLCSIIKGFKQYEDNEAIPLL